MLVNNQADPRNARSPQREIFEKASPAQSDPDLVWQEINQLLWRALAPFPQAREAVARELEAMGDRK